MAASRRFPRTTTSRNTTHLLLSSLTTPSQHHLFFCSSLPSAISDRVAGVNQRHSDLAKKKLLMQARSSAIKEKDRRSQRRIPFFKSAEERETIHKGFLAEDETEIYDCFPPILYLAGFTGATFSPNNVTKRELGMLQSYPKGQRIMSDRTRGIFEQVEARRAFAQKKKGDLLKRGTLSLTFVVWCVADPFRLSSLSLSFSRPLSLPLSSIVQPTS